MKQLCFFDSETRRVPDAVIGDVTRVGAYRYAQEAFATMWTLRRGDHDKAVPVALGDFSQRITMDDMPEWVREFYDEALAGRAWFVAWNAAFDRLIWNGPHSELPPLRIDMTLDAMAQAVAAGLPARLASASAWLGRTVKLHTGSELIKVFEPPNGGTPETCPEQWADFITYGLQDTDAMADIMAATRPLSRADWEVYWASEAINDRGVRLDIDLCSAADTLARVARNRANDQIAELTGGEVTAVTQASAILRWADHPKRLQRRGRARDFFIEKKLVLTDDGEVKRPEKLSLSRDRIELALAFYGSLQDLTPDEKALVQVLELRQFGGSNTPQKFGKAARMAVDGTLQGQYVFNGAAQTGRFSSRGVQTHNLTRSHLGKLEEPAIFDTIALGEAL